MKNTVQARSNGAKNAVSSQRKISSQKAAKDSLPEPGIRDGSFHGKEPVSLLLSDIVSDNILAGTDVMPSELRAIRARAKKLGWPIGGLLRAAVEYLTRGTPLPNYAPAAKYPAVKSKYDKEFDLAEGDKENACLCIFDRENQEPICKIPLSDTEYGELVRRSLASNVPAKNIIADAVRQTLSASAGEALDQLSQTTTKVSGLLRLLADKFSQLAWDAGAEFSSQDKEYATAIALMVRDAEISLLKTYNAVTESVRQNSQEVAS